MKLCAINMDCINYRLIMTCDTLYLVTVKQHTIYSLKFKLFLTFLEMFFSTVLFLLQIQISDICAQAVSQQMSRFGEPSPL